MAITTTNRVKFYFEDTNGDNHEISIIEATGVGVARDHGSTIKSTGVNDLPQVVITVDAGSLAAWKGYSRSRKIHAAVYNTTQSLNTILTV